MPTQNERLFPVSYILECLRHEDGVLYWRERPRSHFRHGGSWKRTNLLAGRVAGRVTNHGYVLVELSRNGKTAGLLAQRIVWAIEHGSWPEQTIDHINRVRHDNRPCNLRDVDVYTNYRNTQKSKGAGLTGAYPTKEGRFMSSIRCDGKVTYLGIFDSELEAHAAFTSARLVRDGEKEKRQ